VLDASWNQTSTRIQFILREKDIIITHFKEMPDGVLIIEFTEQYKRYNGVLIKKENQKLRRGK
jgi:hypothetical protein